MVPLFPYFCDTFAECLQSFQEKPHVDQSLLQGCCVRAFAGQVNELLEHRIPGWELETLGNTRANTSTWS